MSPDTPPFNSLPDEMLSRIFRLLDPQSAARMAQTDRRMRGVANENDKYVAIRDFFYALQATNAEIARIFPMDQAQNDVMNRQVATWESEFNQHGCQLDPLTNMNLVMLIMSSITTNPQANQAEFAVFKEVSFTLHRDLYNIVHDRHIAKGERQDRIVALLSNYARHPVYENELVRETSNVSWYYGVGGAMFFFIIMFIVFGCFFCYKYFIVGMDFEGKMSQDTFWLTLLTPIIMVLCSTCFRKSAESKADMVRLNLGRSRTGMLQVPLSTDLRNMPLGEFFQTIVQYIIIRGNCVSMEDGRRLGIARRVQDVLNRSLELAQDISDGYLNISPEWINRLRRELLQLLYKLTLLMQPPR